MAQLNCQNCRFYQRIAKNDPSDGRGLCRRYPPQLASSMLHAVAMYMREFEDEEDWEDIWGTMGNEANGTSHWRFPVVDTKSPDWCGEFQPVIAD